MPRIRYVKDNEWGTVFPNFRKNEFACPRYCNGFPSEVAYSLLEVMQNLRNKYGAIQVNSGVRCQQFNDELAGSVTDSDHVIGLACDWRFDSHIFSEAEKNEIMQYIRTLPNVNYTYSNQTNMFNGIHVSVYPTYEKANITKFEIKGIDFNSVEIVFEADQDVDFAMYNLNGDEYINLPLSNIISGLTENTKYTLSIKLRTEGTNEWTESQVIEFKTLNHVEETPSIPPVEVPSIPEEKDEEIIVKENPIKRFFKKIFEFIKKLFSKN